MKLTRRAVANQRLDLVSIQRSEIAIGRFLAAMFRAIYNEALDTDLGSVLADVFPKYPDLVLEMRRESVNVGEWKEFPAMERWGKWSKGC